MPRYFCGVEESGRVTDHCIFHNLEALKSFARAAAILLHVHRVALALNIEDVISAVPDMECVATFSPLHIVGGKARHLGLDFGPRAPMRGKSCSHRLSSFGAPPI